MPRESVSRRTACGRWFHSINIEAKPASLVASNVGVIPKNAAPCCSRSRCCCQRNGTPLATRMVSKSPSPYRNARSNTETTACSSGTNLPLRNTIMRAGTEPQSFDKTPRLGEGLLVLSFRYGIGNNPGAHCKVGQAAFAQGRPNYNRELAFTIKPQIAERAGVWPAGDRLKLINDLHGANFWRAGNAAAGETSGQRL